MSFDIQIITAVQSNLYSSEKTGRTINIINLEIEQFIGILLTMRILKHPQYRMYWSQYTKCVTILGTMTLKRFENQKKFFRRVSIAKCQRRVVLIMIQCKVILMLDSLQEICRDVTPGV